MSAQTRHRAYGNDFARQHIDERDRAALEILGATGEGLLVDELSNGFRGQELA